MMLHICAQGWVWGSLRIYTYIYDMHSFVSDLGFFVVVWMFWLYVHVECKHITTMVAHESRREYWFSRTRFTGAFEPLTFWVLRTELCPLEEQQMLLTAELSPSPRTIHLYMNSAYAELEYQVTSYSIVCFVLLVNDCSYFSSITPKTNKMRKN